MSASIVGRSDVMPGVERDGLRSAAQVHGTCIGGHQAKKEAAFSIQHQAVATFDGSGVPDFADNTCVGGLALGVDLGLDRKIGADFVNRILSEVYIVACTVQAEGLTSRLCGANPNPK